MRAAGLGAVAGGVITRAVILCAVLATGSAALADTVSTSNRQALFRSQLGVLDGRAAQQYQDSTRLQPPRAETATAAEPEPAFVGRYNGPYLAVARAAAQRHGIPADLFARLVQQESGWNPNAVSSKGAIGLAQLMPATAARLGVNPRDPAQNLEGGARYLRMQYDLFGSWRLALAAYNAGPGAVQTHGGIPPYRETQGYVRAILGG